MRVSAANEDAWRDADPSRGTKRVSVILALYAIAGGAISFAGWPLDRPRLTDWFNTGVSIQPNASVLIVLAGLALVLAHDAQARNRLVVSALGGFILTAGALILSQYLIDVDLGFNDLLLFDRSWGQSTTETPGRVGPPASSSFILLGTALLLLGRALSWSVRRYVPILGLAVCTLMMFGVFGYLFGAHQFFAIPGLSAIAFQTSTMIMALAGGMIAAVPERQPMLLLREKSGAGALARLLLPALIVLPPLIIWLRTIGMDEGFYDLGTSRALGAVALVVTNVAVMWAALTRLRRREQRERASEERLAGLLGSIGDALVSVDLQWRVTFINDRGLDYVRRERYDVIGRSLWQLLPGIADGVPKARLQLAMDRRQAVEYEVYHSSWSRWVHERAFPTHDGGLTIYSIDITERKKAEEAVRMSRERFRSLVGVITDVPWVTDATGAFRDPQREWEKYTGQTWDRHRDFGWLDALHPDDRETIRALWLEACTSRKLYESRGRLWHEASQSWHHFVARATPLFDPDGSVREWVGTYTDVHSQVLAEETMRTSNQRKDEFLATLAHELRNPLAPIRNAIQILHLKGPQDPELRWAQGVIDRQMQHMSRLVDDLLDVSRISRGRIELRREAVDLSTVLHGAIEASRPLLEERRHRFDLQLPDTPVYLSADLTRLAQVFSNLLNNAAKYTEPGGNIVMRAERQGSDVRVEVRDNGVGIPPAMRERVFELFEQLGTTLERANGGLGIGLTLVKRLVEMHGGDIEVHSDGVGKGSVFVVRLPTQAVPAASTGPTMAERRTLTLPRRVVVVDDNHDAADTMAIMLRAHGCDVETAYDGPSALRLAETFRPEVMLLDIGLPRVSGYDVARTIRSRDWGKDVVLLALTGWGQDEDRRRSMEAGFDHHLVKPVAPATLMALLSEMVTHRQGKRSRTPSPLQA